MLAGDAELRLIHSTYEAVERQIAFSASLPASLREELGYLLSGYLGIVRRASVINPNIELGFAFRSAVSGELRKAASDWRRLLHRMRTGRHARVNTRMASILPMPLSRTSSDDTRL